jgi:hypothetical protein
MSTPRGRPNWLSRREIHAKESVSLHLRTLSEIGFHTPKWMRQSGQGMQQSKRHADRSVRRVDNSVDRPLVRNWRWILSHTEVTSSWRLA